MTRTARASHPRALNRDRSESRTGLDNSIRKGGAGGHNWGSLADESLLEARALDDEDMEPIADSTESDRVAGSEVTKQSINLDASPKPPMDRASSDSSVNSNSLTEEEKAQAKNLRKNAFKKKEIDLAAIARTSGAVNNSLPNGQT